MRSLRSRELAVLFLGDLVFLLLSLWVTLAIRYLDIPSLALFQLHLVPFSLLFIIWLLVFLIAGLYDQHTLVFRARLPERIFRVQSGNIIIAALFFFFLPIFGIAPKTNLILYLLVSFGLIAAWRIALVPLLLRRERRDALLIGGGIEFKELLEEINDNSRYPFRFIDSLNIDHADGATLSDVIFKKLQRAHLQYLVVDLHHRKLVNILPHLYKPIFSNVEFIDVRELYEEIFERMPLSVLGDPGYIEELCTKSVSPSYPFVKRAIDIVGGAAMAIITAIVTPLVWLSMRIESPGPLFILQERLGEGGVRVHSKKFRSMQKNDASSASWLKESKNKVTRVGAFLRKTSLDEYPQFLNVLSGELSLVGPRNDIEGLGKRLAEVIPLYNMRYTVRPGITGWAQINQRYEPGNISPQSIEETKIRLVYDFYYIKHRSLMLDLVIALKTLKRMVFRVSSW